MRGLLAVDEVVIPSDAENGGRGEIVTDRSRFQGDAKLVRTAIRNRWPVTKEMRENVLSVAESVMRDGNPRDSIAAAKILLEADKINVAVTKLDQVDQAAPSQTNIQINVDPAEAGGVKIYLPDNRRD